MDFADEQIIKDTRRFGESIMQSHMFLQESLAANRNKLQEKALLHCLGRSLDLAKGAVSTAIACTPISLATISRTLFEELITAQWLCLNSDNAIKLKEDSDASLCKLLREHLKSGCGKVVHKESGEDNTQDVLKSISAGSRTPSIEQKAKDCRLHDVYTTVYRSLSLLAHGSDFQQSFRPADAQDAVKIFFPAAVVLHKVTYDIATNFLTDGQTTKPTDIKKKLNFVFTATN